MASRIVVRAPRLVDAQDMGRIHVLAWQVGYSGLMPDELLDSLDPEERAQTWSAVLNRPQEDSVSRPVPIVAEVDGAVAGMAAYGPYRAGGSDLGDMCELWMLNVDPTYWGTGVAQELNAHAIAELGRLFPAATAALWVLEENARGRRFYEKEGWEPDGMTRQDNTMGAELTEVRYTIAPSRQSPAS